MDKQLTQNMLAQVRTANRLVLAYYQRLFPLLGKLQERLSDELEANYLHWEGHWGKTPTASGNVLQRCPWSMLPASHMELYYESRIDEDSKGGELCKGDLFLAVYVMTDTAFDSVYREENGCENIDDALLLPPRVEEAESFIRVVLIKYTANNQGHKNWYSDIWDKVPWPERTASPERQEFDSDYPPCIASAFEFPLEDFIEEEGIDQLIEKITEYRDCLTLD